MQQILIDSAAKAGRYNRSDQQRHTEIEVSVHQPVAAGKHTWPSNHDVLRQRNHICWDPTFQDLIAVRLIATEGYCKNNRAPQIHCQPILKRLVPKLRLGSTGT